MVAKGRSVMVQTTITTSAIGRVTSQGKATSVTSATNGTTGLPATIASPPAAPTPRARRMRAIWRRVGLDWRKLIIIKDHPISLGIETVREKGFHIVFGSVEDSAFQKSTMKVRALKLRRAS